MTPKAFFAVVWRRRLVAVLAGCLVILAGFAFLSTQKKTYQSSALIGILPNPANTNSLTSYPVIIPSLIPTYIQQLSSTSFLDQVAGSLPFSATGTQLGSDLSAVASTNASVITITATMPTANESEIVAKAATTTFMNLQQNNQIVQFQVYSYPQLPTAPASPHPKLVIGASVILAIIIAIAAALGWDKLFGRVFEAGELEESTGLAVLGILPDEKRLKNGSRLVIGTPGLTRLEESIRALRTNFVFATGGGKMKTVAITSLGAEEGKTTVAVNLAVVAAELGLNVVLIDGDIHRPQVHEVFNIPNSTGLTSLVTEGLDPKSVLYEVPGIPNLRVVPAGKVLSDRRDEANLYLRHMGSLSELGDLVIIDAPPLQAGADVRLLAMAAEGVLLVCRAGSSTQHQLSTAVRAIENLDVNVVGSVLTRAKDTSEIDKGISYYSHYRGADQGPLAPSSSTAGQLPSKIPSGNAASGNGANANKPKPNSNPAQSKEPAKGD